MQNLQESLDKATSEQKLEDFDIEFYYEGIESQLDNLLSMSSKKNYLKKFENKINDPESFYPDEIVETKDVMYNDVINMISNRLGFEIDKSEVSLGKLAKTLYKFFVLNYTDNITYFLEMFILENKKDICRELENRSSSSKRIEGVDSKIALILNNISDTIEIIKSMDISFGEYIEYINKHSDASSSVNDMIEYEHDLITESDEIMEGIFNELLNEEEGFGKIYTDLQINIFERFKSSDM